MSQSQPKSIGDALIVGIFALAIGMALYSLKSERSAPSSGGAAQGAVRNAVRIELSGEHEVRRVPELCDVYIRLHDESKVPGEAMQRVSAAAEALAEKVTPLAPAKRSTAPRVALDLDASEATDVPEEYPPSQPEKPVTGWSLQQIRSWTFERLPPNNNNNNARNHQLVDFAVASAGGPDEAEAEQYGKFYVAEAAAKVTFHDFGELSKFVMDLSVSTSELSLERGSEREDRELDERKAQANIRTRP